MSLGLVPGGLVESSFAERLASWLDAARGAVGAEVLAVIDLDASSGYLAPRWRASPRTGTDALITPRAEMLRQLLAPDGDSESAPGTTMTSGANRGDPLDTLASALGVGRVIALPLDVTPRLVAGMDAILVAGFADISDEARLAVEGLRPVLEEGLTADRRARLAEAVWEAVEQAPDAVELTDREARLFYANAAWERRFGYRLRDVAGRTVGSLFRDPVAPLHDAAFYHFTMTTLAAGRNWLGAIAGRTSQGRRVMSEVNVGPFTAGGAGFQGNVAVRRDIAHRELRDEALAAAHHEFSHVLSAVPEGVAVLRDGRVYFANPALLHTLQRSADDVVGRPYVDFVHPDDRARFQVEHREGVTRVRLVDAQGLPRFTEISTAGNVSFEGEAAMILLARDTTDYEVARQRLAHADKLAAVGSIAAGIAHQINNPLAFVTLNLESLGRSIGPSLSADDQEAIDDALDGARRIAHIVGNLNAFGRSEQTGPAAAVEVEKVVTSALGIAQNEVRQRVHVTRDHQAGLAIAADEGQLVQVLVSLLVNAAQAAPPEDPEKDLAITVRSRQVDQQVEIVVSDAGVGIPSGLLRRVFEPFFSAKPSGKRAGLGLAIAKQIVHSARGEITIASELGKGTAVTILLPLARLPDAQPNLKPFAGAGERPLKTRARILIIDDENAIAASLRRSLSDHAIETVAGADAGLKHLIEDPMFDVVLCDLMMPGLTGPELYRRVCAAHPALSSRFIFMTGGGSSSEAAAFVAGSGCRLLEKPFDVEKLERAVLEVAASGSGGGGGGGDSGDRTSSESPLGPIGHAPSVSSARVPHP